MDIQAVLKPSAPIRTNNAYPRVVGINELASYDIGQRDAAFYIRVDEAQELHPEEFPEEIKRHISHYYVRSCVDGLDPIQGEHLEDDARAIVTAWAIDDRAGAIIRIRATSLTKLFKLHSDILAGKNPTRAYRTAPKHF